MNRILTGAAIGAGLFATWYLLNNRARVLALRLPVRVPNSSDLIDETLDDSFPASDSPSYTPTTGSFVR